MVSVGNSIFAIADNLAEPPAKSLTEIFAIVEEVKGDGTFTKEYVRGLFDLYNNSTFHWINFTQDVNSSRAAPIMETGSFDEHGASLYRLR